MAIPPVRLTPAPRRQRVGSHRAWWLLLALQLFNAVSAIGGGLALIFFDGLGMPQALLAATPFVDFVIPGVILTCVVGGTQLAAAAAQWFGSRWYLVLAGVAAIGMIIWIYVEVALLPGYSFLHTLYFTSGVAQLVLGFFVLGGWPVVAPEAKPVDNG